MSAEHTLGNAPLNLPTGFQPEDLKWKLPVSADQDLLQYILGKLPGRDSHDKVIQMALDTNDSGSFLWVSADVSDFIPPFEISEDLRTARSEYSRLCGTDKAFDVTAKYRGKKERLPAEVTVPAGTTFCIAIPGRGQKLVVAKKDFEVKPIEVSDGSFEAQSFHGIRLYLPNDVFPMSDDERAVRHGIDRVLRWTSREEDL